MFNATSGGGPIFVWPLCAAATSFFVQGLAPAGAAWSRVVSVIIAIIALAWTGALGHFLFLGVGADLPLAILPLLVPVLALLAPLMPQWPRRTTLVTAGSLLL